MEVSFAGERANLGGGFFRDRFRGDEEVGPGVGLTRAYIDLSSSSTLNRHGETACFPRLLRSGRSISFAFRRFESAVDLGLNGPQYYEAQLPSGAWPLSEFILVLRAIN